MRSKNINHYNQVTKALTICLCGLLGIVSLSAAVLSSIKVNADGDTYSVTDTISATVPTACTMSGSGEESHTASLMPGTYSASSGSPYENGIGSTTLTTYCNDSEGFAIYAIGYTNDTLGNTNLIGALSSHPTITTGTATTGDTSNWAMKVNKVTDPTTSYMPAYMYIDGSFDTNYKAVPSTYTKVAHYQATAGTPSSTDATLGAKVTTTYAAYVAPAQVADTYTGQVKYIMVHPNSFVAGTYTIAYNANGGTGTMTSETGVSNMAEHTLKANTFTAPSGYGFAGWCTVQDSGANPQTTCSGTSYADEGTVPLSTVGNGGTLTLYAYWSLIPYICDTETCMQDLDSTSIATLLPNVGDTATVYDNRDEQAYTIAKLADNKYWMLDNLALDLTNSTILNAMDQDNTNASNTTLGYLRSGGGTTSDKYATAGVSNWTSSFSYSAPLVNLTNKDVIPTDATSTAGGWKVGGYYNYCAASAGSYCYGNGTSAGTSSGDATEDICPKGWRMPTGYSTGEFKALYNNASYNTYAKYRAALHLPLSGYFLNSSPSEQGRTGQWWSSTQANNYNMFTLGLDDKYAIITPDNYYAARNRGNSLRCIIGS